MFVLSVRVHASTPERRELVQALLGWLAAVRRSFGLAEAHVSEDLEVAGTYVLSSAWHRREDLETHVGGPDFGVLLGAFDVLGREMQLVVTAAAEGAEDGVSHVRRLRRRVRLHHEHVAAVTPDAPAKPEAGGL